jgi:hypothetical protein
VSCHDPIVLLDIHHYGEREEDSMTRRMEVAAVVAGAVVALTVVGGLVGAVLAMFLISSP